MGERIPSPGAHGHDAAEPRGEQRTASADAYSAAMHAAMAKMAHEVAAAPMTGDPDRDFLAMMIPHHEAAVEMARLVLIHGRDPLVRQLAADIIATQQAEIVSMQSRLRILHGGRDPDPGGFPALGGTRGGADR